MEQNRRRGNTNNESTYFTPPLLLPDNAVSGHGQDEVFPSLLIFDAGFIAEQLLEINRQPDIRLTSQLIPRFAVRNTFDHAASRKRGNSEDGAYNYMYM